ncbi:hypothetical protein D9619_013679 [Psilocybe cf. subviscida]|uniref:Uncharacterized protein n=1 Tax=Psilocybe cf. subviscida TaxID=2480587 RepID=A0A8H5EVF3_9AGAR|nr:hypothetical protein D9619_013679 [Psilocybe cf. subviscida]
MTCFPTVSPDCSIDFQCNDLHCHSRLASHSCLSRQLIGSARQRGYSYQSNNMRKFVQAAAIDVERVYNNSRAACPQGIATFPFFRVPATSIFCFVSCFVFAMSFVPLLDASFNPLVLEGFLSGVYFLLFVQAIWKLFQKRAHGPYILALILLWMTSTSSFIFDWVRARNAFVVNNSSPLSILLSFEASSNTESFVLILLGTIISDGILIWRCTILWKSKPTLCILVALLVASSVFNLLVIVLPRSSVRFTLLSVALGILFSAATTVLATSMIALKIILVTRESRSQYSYTKVIEILVQSAALQSAVLLVNGIIVFMAYVDPTLLVAQMNAYTSSFRRVLMGIAPTLIAFRVADEEPRTEITVTNRSAPISHLTFRRSTRGMDTDSRSQRTWISTIHFDGSDREDYSHRARSQDGLSKREIMEKDMYISGPQLV